MRYVHVAVVIRILNENIELCACVNRGKQYVNCIFEYKCNNQKGE